MYIVSQLSVLIDLLEEDFEVLKHANLLAVLRHSLPHLIHLMLTLLAVLAAFFAFSLGGCELHEGRLHGLVLFVENAKVVVERNTVGVRCFDERGEVLSEPAAAFSSHSCCGCVCGREASEPSKKL